MLINFYFMIKTSTRGGKTVKYVHFLKKKSVKHKCTFWVTSNFEIFVNFFGFMYTRP